MYSNIEYLDLRGYVYPVSTGTELSFEKAKRLRKDRKEHIRLLMG